MLDLAMFEAQLRPLREGLLRVIDDHARESTPERAHLLRQVRLELAVAWTRLPGDELARALDGVFGELHERLMYCGLRELPLSPEEEEVLRRLDAALARGWGHAETPAAFLAATMFAPAHRTNVPLDLDAGAPWLWGPALRYLFEVPRLFLEPGEAGRYLGYVRRVIVWLADRVVPAPGPFQRLALAAFADSAFIVQGYFHEENLRDVLEKRAAILEHMIAPHADLDGPAPKQRPPRRRPRVGFLAPHYNPQTETFYLLSHYEHLDRDRFEVILYALGRREHALHDLCAAHADRVVFLPAHDIAACAAQIRKDDLDLLVFGSNLTAAASPSAKLALFRLAPLQMATINCPATTGMRHIDLFLSPALNEPADADTHYRERLLRLPGWPNVFAYQQDVATATATVTRAGLGIGEDAVVFASGANYFKILPELDHTFGRILAAVPDGVLLLYPFNPNWSTSYQTAPLVQRLQRHLAAHGVAPERLLIQPPVPTRADVHARLELADVYLDGVPYSGSCSLIDPLQVGCPPVVRDGTIMRTRQGAAIMRSLGLDELVAPSIESYEALAIALGRDRGRRLRLRAEIAARMLAPPVLDTAGFSRAFGEVLAELLDPPHPAVNEAA
jgi:hypothetical protein